MATSDRHSNGCSHDTIRGGDISSSQHPSWPLGHPEAHTSTPPGFGSISEIPPKFSQCTIPARDSTLSASSTTGVSGCTVWGHHTSIVGSDADTRTHLTPATPTTAIPTAIKTSNRWATIRSGRIPRTTPPPLIIGSTPSPSTGGSTGLTSASRATDTPPHDSHPAVGHPHHASSSGASHPPLVAPINHRGSTGQSIHNNIIGRIPYNLPPRPPNITPSPQHHPGMPNSPRRTPDHRLLHMRPHRPASIGIFTPPLSPSPLLFSLCAASSSFY